MFCIECGKNIEANAKFCAECGSKQIALITTISSKTESNSDITNSQATVAQKWYQRRDLQALNFFHLTFDLFSIFALPYVTLTSTIRHVTNPEPTYELTYIRAIQEPVGKVMLIIIFFMFYCNYVRNFKPLIFIYPFLSLCMIWMIFSAMDFGNPLIEIDIQFFGYFFVFNGIAAAFMNHKLHAELIKS